MRRVDRRGFLTSIGGFLALAISGGDEGQPRRLLAAERLKMFTSEHQLAHHFSTVLSGRLMELYQLFPASPATAGEALAWIDRTRESMKDPEILALARPHRRRALPGVMAVHSAAMLSANIPSTPSDVRSLWDEFVTTHAHAFYEKHEPHREVLEILWQNATAAIVRSEEAWLTLSAPEALFDLARDVCIEFLQGERLLLPAAMAAWQFVLTSARARSVSHAGPQPQALQAVIDHANALETAEGIWFLRLHKFYQRVQTFEETLPQHGELVIGRQHDRWREPANLALLARVHLLSSFEAIAEGRHHSRFVQVGDDADRVQGAVRSFLHDYGSELATLRDAAIGLNRDDIADSCDSLPDRVRGMPIGSEPPSDVAFLKARTPFRQAAEHSLAAKLHHVRRNLMVAVRRDDRARLEEALMVAPITLARSNRSLGLNEPDVFREPLSPILDTQLPLWNAYREDTRVLSQVPTIFRASHAATGQPLSNSSPEDDGRGIAASEVAQQLSGFIDDIELFVQDALSAHIAEIETLLDRRMGKPTSDESVPVADTPGGAPMAARPTRWDLVGAILSEDDVRRVAGGRNDGLQVESVDETVALDGRNIARVQPSPGQPDAPSSAQSFPRQPLEPMSNEVRPGRRLPFRRQIFDKVVNGMSPKPPAAILERAEKRLTERYGWVPRQSASLDAHRPLPDPEEMRIVNLIVRQYFLSYQSEGDDGTLA